MSGKPIWICGALCLLTTATFAGEPAMQFSREVALPDLQQEELVSVLLDSAIYDATQNDLDDLRLIDSEGLSVPFWIRKAKSTRTRTTQRTWIANKIAAKPVGEGGLEITVELNRDDPTADGLKLVTPLDNFEKQIRVETSENGNQWEEVARAQIFDYSRFVDVRRDSVPFPKTNRRHFRILIDNVTAIQESELLELTRKLQGKKEVDRQESVIVNRRPFRIDKVEFWSDRQQEVSEFNESQTYPISDFRVEQDADAKQTHILFDTKREPLTTLTIETPERNFSRRAIVEVEQMDGVRKRWHALGNAMLTRIDFKDLNREQLSVQFSEARQRNYRVVIENHDNPPLEITGISAKGNVNEIIFLGKPEQEFLLIYGNSEAKPADYDTAALKELLQAGYKPRPAELGEPESYELAKESGFFSWSVALNNRILQFAIIAVLVIVLGLGLYRAARRMDETPAE